MGYYFFVAILWGVIWGFATRAVILNKGYEYEGTKWFWLGFFFSFIAIIVAATKPQYAPPTISRPKTNREREQEILDEGGWKCVCGNVNYNYVTSCSCGKAKRDGDVKKQIKVMPTQPEEKSDAAKIREFKELLDAGIITQEEFEAKKKQILGL